MKRRPLSRVFAFIFSNLNAVRVYVIDEILRHRIIAELSAWVYERWGNRVGPAE